MGDQSMIKAEESGLLWLVCVAAPKEARAVLEGLDSSRPVPDPWQPLQLDGCEILRTGVGKAAAAGAVGRWFDPQRHAGVLSVGIAGALPGAWVEIGSSVLADSSVFADEGVLTPKGFQSLADMGFGADSEPVRPDEPTRRAIQPLVDVIAPIATVSVCSGDDAWAADIAHRTGGLAEAMEGAAIGLTVRRIDPSARFAEVRVISNTTGDRDRQRWDLDAGLAGLAALMKPTIQSLMV